jgi:hypothetical protein
VFGFAKSEFLIVVILQVICGNFYVVILMLKAELGNAFVFNGFLTGMAPFIESFLCALGAITGRFVMRLLGSPARGDNSDCMHITMRFGKTVLPSRFRHCSKFEY